MSDDRREPTVRDQLDWIADVFRRTASQWWLIVLLGLVGSAAAYGVVSLRSQFYQSETVIMHRDVIPDDLVRRSAGGTSSERHMHARFSEMLRAKPLLEPIIEKSGLFADIIAKEGMESAVEEMRELTRLRSRGGGMFNISFRARRPELAQDITRQLAQGLMDWEMRLQLESASVARDFMAEERERLAAELAVREREMAQFLAAHPEFARENQLASAGTGASIRAMDASKRPRSSGSSGSRAAFSDLIDLERRRAEVKTRLDAGGNRSRTPARRSPEQRRADETLTRALRDRDRARSQLAALRAQFTDRHPDVVTALATLADANQAVDSARAALARAPAEDADGDSSFDAAALTAELQSLDAQISAARKQVARSASSSSSRLRSRRGSKLADLVGLETQWGQLLREFRAVQERYASIESKAFAADMTASSEIARQGTQLTVVSPATLPASPAGFPSLLLLAAGVLMSFAGGVAVALARVLLDDRVFARRDLDQLDVAPTLAVIPR